MFDGHQHGSAPLAADRDPLHQTQRYEQRRRPEPYRIVGRQEPYQERGCAHQEERKDEHRLPPHLVSEVSKEHPAQRAGEEPYPEGGEGQQGSDELAGLREEQGWEDQGRGRSVNKEVVVFRGSAYQAGACDGSDRGPLPKVFSPYFLHHLLSLYISPTTPGPL